MLYILSALASLATTLSLLFVGFLFGAYFMYKNLAEENKLKQARTRKRKRNCKTNETSKTKKPLGELE